MKRHIVIALVLMLAAFSLVAQETSTQPSPQSEPKATFGGEAVEAPETPPATVKNLFSNFIDANLQGVDVDSNSSKFREYRDVPEGLAGPSLRVFGSTEKSQFLITAEHIQESDRRFDVGFENDAIGIDVFYDQIPHRLGNEAHSILTRAADEAWGVSDLAQLEAQQRLEAQFATNKAGINFAFLSAIAANYTNSPYVFDLGYDRRRGGLDVQLFPSASVDTHVTFFQENRDGTRAAGTSFGFGNVVETGEPIDYTTREAGVRVEMPFSHGLVRGSVAINQFQNRIGSYTFDNPWRATDSTDPSAYTGPASGSINGASFGRIALAPDSQQLLASIGGVWKFPVASSRLTADLTFGELTSSENLIPFTSNSAIFTPSGQAANASGPQSFDGEINSTRGTVTFTTRPMPGLNITARYRMYDNSNDSPRVRLEEGYVRFDAVWEDIPRITVPYSWKNNRLDLYATYDFGIASVEGGYRHDVMERTFRETEETTEGTFHVALDLRPASWLVARTSYEFGSRDFDEYDFERSEDASFIEPQAPANLPELRRYDQAKKDTQRIISMIQVSPFDALTMSANYVRYFDDYSDDSSYGLLKSRTQAYTLEGDYTPSARWDVFAFFTHDDLRGLQRGRQSGATPSTNPLDDWTADLTDKADTWGVGATFNVVPDKIAVTLSSQMQQVAGWNTLASPPGGTPDLAFSIPNVDDTRIFTTLAELSYEVSKAWNLGLGGWFENYSIDDALQTGVQPYMPGGFFLVPNDGDYRGVVAYVRSTYRW